jgi:hypothetical protein
LSSGDEENPSGPIGREEAAGSDLNARLMVWWSLPLVRFGVRAAIPIVIVVAVAIVIGSH